MILFLFILFMAMQTNECLAQQSPAVEVRTSNYRYDTKFESLDKVPFSNLQVFYGGGKYQLKNGRYSESDPKGFGGEEIKLEQVWLIRHGINAPTHAIVSYKSKSCGAHCAIEGFVQVLTLRAGKLLVLQEFRYTGVESVTGAWFKDDTKTLLVVGRSDDKSPVCCPERVDKVSYRWDGSLFQIKEWKTAPIAKDKM